MVSLRATENWSAFWGVLFEFEQNFSFTAIILLNSSNLPCTNFRSDSQTHVSQRAHWGCSRNALAPQNLPASTIRIWNHPTYHPLRFESSLKKLLDLNFLLSRIVSHNTCLSTCSLARLPLMKVVELLSFFCCLFVKVVQQCLRFYFSGAFNFPVNSWREIEYFGKLRLRIGQPILPSQNLV